MTTLKAPPFANGIAIGGRVYPVVDGFVHDVQADHLESLQSHGYSVPAEPEPESDQQPETRRRGRAPKAESEQ